MRIGPLGVVQRTRSLSVPLAPNKRSYSMSGRVISGAFEPKHRRRATAEGGCGCPARSPRTSPRPAAPVSACSSCHAEPPDPGHGTRRFRRTCSTQSLVTADSLVGGPPVRSWVAFRGRSGAPVSSFGQTTPRLSGRGETPWSRSWAAMGEIRVLWRYLLRTCWERSCRSGGLPGSSSRSRCEPAGHQPDHGSFHHRFRVF